MVPIDDLAEALDNREMTDAEGKVIEENETPKEDSSASEYKTTAEEDAQAEKPAESEESETQSETEEDGIDLVELASDEAGKKYVPESRFKEVYAKMKGYERALNEAPKQPEFPKPLVNEKPLDKTDQVEIELLRATLPQFNPAGGDTYSRELDELGFAIYKATPGITRLDAARKAIEMAKKIQSRVAKVEEEARVVKSQQSDQGITSRVTARDTSDVPPEDASAEVLEGWLKAHGQW